MHTEVDQARDLGTLVGIIWTIVTVSVLPIALRWSSEKGKYHLGRSTAAVVLLLICTVVGFAVVFVLSPLAYKSVAVNNGDVEPVLVLYDALVVLVVGLTLTVTFYLAVAVQHLVNVMRSRRDL